MKEKEKNIKTIVIRIAMLMAIVLIFYFSSKAITKYTGKTITGGAIKTEVMEKFAKCLSESNVKMYGSCECYHCENQKRMFGDNFKYIDYVECKEGCSGANVNLCNDKNIPGYPTWELNGNLYPGEINLDKLSELSGCEI